MRKLRLPGLLLLLFFLTATVAWAKNENILVICPYVPSNSWGQRALAPINQLANENSDFNFQFSVLKSTDYSTSVEVKDRLNSISGVYGMERPDLAIIYGPANYEAARHINEKWPGIPIILIGEIEYMCKLDYILDSYANEDAVRENIADMVQELNCTFIKTPVYPGRTLDLMKSLLPKMEEVFFIGGDDFMSKEVQLMLARKSEERKCRFHAFLSSDHSIEDLIKSVQSLDQQKIGIIYCNWFSKVNPENNAHLGIRRLVEAHVPVFNIYGQDFKSDDGVGFITYDAGEYKEKVQETVLKILRKKIPARKIEPVIIKAGKPVLNSEALMKYNFDRRLAPEGTVFVNNHPSFLETHKNDIIIGASILTVLFIFMLITLLIHGNSLNKQLRQAKKRAETSDRSKTIFLQNMSHEIRTPMNAIVGFSQLLALPDGYSTEEEKKEYAGYIQNNAKMLMMLIDDILDIADAEHGNYRIDLTDASCNEICTSAMKSVEFRVPPEVKMYFTTDLPDDFKIHTDSRRVQQVLINYLTNACKHTLQGEIKVSCSKSEHPGSITFSVTDTGTGIPSNMAENIFERFTKLDAFVQGSGLGLNICRTIAQKLGAQVKLDTSYTKGARFLFIVPLH